MKKSQNGKFNNRRRLGFTLIELVITIAIVSVLAGVVAIGITSMNKSLAQKELNEEASLMYIAAENRFAQIEASGESSLLDGGKEVSDGIKYIESGTEDAEKILPAGYLDTEIYNKYWVIEYNSATGEIIAVYISDESLNYTPAKREAIAKQATEDKSGKIGYFSSGDGNGENAKANTETLHPYINIENGEDLVATVTLPAPSNSNLTLKLEITVADKDNENKKCTETVELNNSHLNGVTNEYTYTVVLDSIKDAKDRFYVKYKNCTAGKDVIVSVTAVAYEKGTKNVSKAVDSYTVSAETNSLFASVTVNADNSKAYDAEISCGRHLQNLRKTPAGSSENSLDIQVINVTQISDIDWSEEYPDMSFVPIKNDDIKTYYGKKLKSATSENFDYFIIYNLKVDISSMSNVSAAGLFESFAGTRIDNVRLCGAEINGGSKPAGSIVGTFTGTDTLTIAGSRIYLDVGVIEDKTYINGSDVGGLVGSNGTSKAISISDCYVATVIGTSASANVGGLVGKNEKGTIYIAKTYTDCYLYGENVGGFVGSGTAKKIQNSYTAGYITSTKTGAGFVNGTINNSSSNKLLNCYSIICFKNCTGATYSLAKNLKSASEVSNVFYGAEGNTKSTNTENTVKLTEALKYKLLEKLGDKFKDSSTTTCIAYNLKGEVPYYEFPIISGRANYGDWEVDLSYAKWALSEEEKTITYDILKEDNNTKTFKIYCSSEEITTANFTSTDENVAKVTSVSEIQELEDGHVTENSYREVTIEFCGDVGTAEITGTIGKSSDTINITVTANLYIKADKTDFTIYKEESEAITLDAGSSENATDYSSRSDLNWEITYSNASNPRATVTGTNGSRVINALKRGTETITIKAYVEKNSKTYYSNEITVNVTIKECKAEWSYTWDNIESKLFVKKYGEILFDGFYSDVTIRLYCSAEEPIIDIDNTDVVELISISDLQGSAPADDDSEITTYRDLVFRVKLNIDRAYVTATVGNATDTFQVSVLSAFDYIADTSTKEITLELGKTVELGLFVLNSNGNKLDTTEPSWHFSYASGNNTKIINVTKQGNVPLVTGKEAGEETIIVYATYKGSKTNKVEIKVKVVEPETKEYNVTYYGSKYTKPSNTIAKIGENYTATLKFEQGISMEEIVVYAGNRVLYEDEGYSVTSSRTGEWVRKKAWDYEYVYTYTYTLTINADYIYGAIEVYPYTGSKESNYVSVNFENRTSGASIYYITDNNQPSTSNLISGANSFAVKGKEYVVYLAGYHYNIDEGFTVACGGKTLVLNDAYTVEQTASGLLYYYKIQIKGECVTGDITITRNNTN